MSQERTGIVSARGNGLTLLGPDIAVGDKAPDFTVVDNDMQPVTLADAAGKVQLIASVPSLDTGVCDAMTRRFNQEVAALGDKLVAYTISMDLPFAQKRWCGNAGIEAIKTLSDYQERSFAQNWGLLVKENKLIARAIYIVDTDGKVAYRQIVPELPTEPDYDDAMAALKKLL